jgi:hypothetical protein
MLTAGQNWSTFMDVKVLPEGMTEPTLFPVFGFLPSQRFLMAAR